MEQPEAAQRRWLLPVLLLTATVVIARWLFLAVGKTELSVDEAQYWLWGQEFAFGYYSKPPLIAWVIGAVTRLAGNDSTFWVRAPAALFNGCTAVLVAAIAARAWGPRSAIWAAVGYLSMPIVSYGSLLISTDTVMAPFFAAAMLVYLDLCKTRQARHAVIVGVLIGVAMLAKYAALYFLAGAALAAIIFPEARIGWRNAGLLLMSCLVVISPNLWWNVTNGLATVMHTADNIGWIEGGPKSGSAPLLIGWLTFMLSQFGIVGPIVFGALLAALWRFRKYGVLTAFAFLPLAAVSVQSILDGSNANWAVTAYFSGVPLAMEVLASHRILRLVALSVSVLFSLLIHLMTLFPVASVLGYGNLMNRYVGLRAMSDELLELSASHGNVPIYTRTRDVISGLFYEAHDASVPYYAPRRSGRPLTHYEQRYPLPADITGPILAVLRDPPPCPDLAPPVPVGRVGGYLSGRDLEAYLVDAACLSASQ